MAVTHRKGWWLTGLLVLSAAAGAGFFLLQPEDKQLPYINTFGLKKLAYFDKQIANSLARGSARRTDVDYVVEVVDFLIDRGRLTGDGRDFDNAIALLDESEAKIATRTRTEDGVMQIPELYTSRAKVLAARHRFVEAIEVANKGLRKYQHFSSLEAIVGECSVQIGDMQAAEAVLRRLVNSEFRIANNYIGLAYWAEVAGDLEQASDLLSRAPEASFPKPLPRLRLAYIYAVHGDVKAKGGKLAEARAFYLASLEQERTTAQAKVGLADLAAYEGKLDEAEKLLREVIDGEWPNAEYQAKLADIREQQGDKVEAKKLRRAAEKYFEWSVGTGFEGYLRPLALLKLKQGEFREAGKYAARDLAIRPNRESRAVYQSIYDQALAAGSPLKENAIQKLDADTAARKATVAAGG